jgi:hypothetical protein
MDVDDETLQIQADVQLARERLRAREARKMRERAAANNDDNDDIDDSRTGEAAEARDVPHNNPGSKTEIGRRWGLGGVSAEDYERIKARIEKRRERAAANNDNNDDTDDSRTGEAAEARNVQVCWWPLAMRKGIRWSYFRSGKTNVIICRWALLFS